MILKMALAFGLSVGCFFDAAAGPQDDSWWPYSQLTQTKYCHIGFGENLDQVFTAEIRNHKLVIHTGYRLGRPVQKLRVYRSGKVSLDEVKIASESGESVYEITSITRNSFSNLPFDHLEIHAKVIIDGRVYEQFGFVELVSDLTEAKWAHFDGPLSIEVYDDIGFQIEGFIKYGPTKLVLAKDPPVQEFVVGTIDEDRGCWVVVVNGHDNDNVYQSAFPEGVFPSLQSTFHDDSSGEVSRSRQTVTGMC